jgi:hypothetical protein
VDLNGCALPGQGSDGAEGGIGWTATTLLVLSVVVFAAAGWTFFTGRETSYTPSSEEE